MSEIETIVQYMDKAFACIPERTISGLHLKDSHRKAICSALKPEYAVGFAFTFGLCRGYLTGKKAAKT